MSVYYTKSKRLDLLNKSFLGYVFRVAYQDYNDGHHSESIKNLIEECFPDAYNIDGENITFDVDATDGVLHMEFKDGAFHERGAD